MITTEFSTATGVRVERVSDPLAPMTPAEDAIPGHNSAYDRLPIMTANGPVQYPATSSPAPADDFGGRPTFEGIEQPRQGDSTGNSSFDERPIPVFEAPKFRGDIPVLDPANVGVFGFEAPESAKTEREAQK